MRTFFWDCRQRQRVLFRQYYSNRGRFQYDFFFTDDFKINSKLTVNYGIRYELHPGWQEKNGNLATFDIGTGSIVVQDGSLANVSAALPDELRADCRSQ